MIFRYIFRRDHGSEEAFGHMDRLEHIGDASDISKGESVVLQTMRGHCFALDTDFIML